MAKLSKKYIKKFARLERARARFAEVYNWWLLAIQPGAQGDVDDFAAMLEYAEDELASAVIDIQAWETKHV